MRAVTLKELYQWVEKNKHRTWQFENFGPDDRKRKTLEIKYLDFSIDTRDMEVWRIGIEGVGLPQEVFRDDNDKDDKTILDALESKLKTV